MDPAETSLRVFNTAKLYAEKILFPMIEMYQRHKRQSDYGCENLEDSVLLSEELKDIQRYNGLKGMNDILHSLITTIASTVIIKNSKEEIEQLKSITALVEQLKKLFYEEKEKFFKHAFKGTEVIEVLNREYFEKVKKIVETCYVNTEILMTRNKLLFADSADEFMSDKEIQEQIKKEYIEG